ncbi:LOW QUALITY PROTEIN: hypothetical protein CFOL_v3_21331, partial [Cephalotus follicularis]
SVMMPSDDQCFLLYFILGTYFGPDLKGEIPQKSALQRNAEGLAPYTSNQLVGSHMKRVEVARAFYYVLRKADQSLQVGLSLLDHLFRGTLPADGHDPTAIYQFNDLFPSQLHLHSISKNKHDTIENIVFITNPESYFIKQEDIERFKRLTGLDQFRLDRGAARLHTFVDDGVSYNAAAENAESNGNSPAISYRRSPRKKRCVDDIMQSKDRDVLVSSVPYNVTYNNMAPMPTENVANSVDKVGPAMIFLPSYPAKEEWINMTAATKSRIALTGSAVTGQVGPLIGLLDIGECEDSYLFLVSLPGVKRDEREFSCEVEDDGKVLIRGVTTTGERTVYRYCQKFEMQTRNLCPPGHFSLSFQLPGPVDPHQFSGNLGNDGILEGIVMKVKCLLM